MDDLGQLTIATGRGMAPIDLGRPIWGCHEILRAKVAHGLILLQLQRIILQNALMITIEAHIHPILLIRTIIIFIRIDVEGDVDRLVNFKGCADRTCLGLECFLVNVPGRLWIGKN